MGEAASRAEGGRLGDRLLELVTERVQKAGGSWTVSTKQLAEELGVKPSAVAYQLHRLAREGRITTAAAGPKGTTIHLGSAGARRAGRGRAAGAAAPAPGRRVRMATATYCPWCGRRVQDHSWRYCPSCGKRLP